MTENAQHVVIERHVRDLCSQGGARQAVEEIRAYHRDRKVSFRLESIATRNGGSDGRHIICIRSNLLNGKPRA